MTDKSVIIIGIPKKYSYTSTTYYYYMTTMWLSNKNTLVGSYTYIMASKNKAISTSDIVHTIM